MVTVIKKFPLAEKRIWAIALNVGALE